MQTVITIGLDIAKSVFLVHGIDAEGKVIIRRQLKRRYVLPFFQKLPSWCPSPLSLSVRNACKSHSCDLSILTSAIDGVGPRLAGPKCADGLLGIAAQHFRRNSSGLVDA